MESFRRNQGIDGGERPPTPYNTRSNTPEPGVTSQSSVLSKIEESMSLNLGEAPVVQSMTVEARFSVAVKFVIYLVLNVVVTLFNKSLLTTYPYPWVLTTFHSVANVVCTQVLGRFGNFIGIRQASQVQFDSLAQLGVSFLFIMNIAASNTSLGVVSITVHQTFRAAIPFLTALITGIYYKRYCSGTVYLTLVAIFSGAITATYDPFDVSLVSLCFGLLGAQLAAWKSVIIHRLQVTGQHFQPLELLRSIAPMSMLFSFFWAYMNGELDHFVVQELHGGHLKRSSVHLFLLNGALAFALNWSSFSLNRSVGPLTMGVAGNVKQVTTITMALLLAHESKFIHWSGVVVTIIAFAYYTWLEHGPREEYLPLYHEHHDTEQV